MSLSLRARDECGGISQCRRPKMLECRGCGTLHGPYPSRPEACPKCGSKLYQKQRCGACPVLELESLAASSPHLGLYESAVRIDAATKCGLHVGLSDLSEAEFLALRVLNEEVAKYQWEKAQHERKHHPIQSAI